MHAKQTSPLTGMDKRQCVRVNSQTHSFTVLNHIQLYCTFKKTRDTWKSRFEAQVKQQYVLFPPNFKFKKWYLIRHPIFWKNNIVFQYCWMAVVNQISLINYSLCVGTKTIWWTSPEPSRILQHRCGSPWTFTSYSTGAQIYHSSKKKLSLTSWFI